MTELTSQTTFDILAPLPTEEDTLDLVLLPENAGAYVLRELRYPDDVLPPLVYGQNPDKWDNFDTVPLTARPLLKAEMALQDTRLTRWPGYLRDKPVREVWEGDNQKSHMESYFFRRLWEYFANPPITGYITWWPKDRTTRGYYIEIENLTVGGDGVTLHTGAIQGGLVMGEVALTFRIIGEVPE